MSKYDPLWDYIKNNAPTELSFDALFWSGVFEHAEGGKLGAEAG